MVFRDEINFCRVSSASLKSKQQTQSKAISVSSFLLEAKHGLAQVDKNIISFNCQGKSKEELVKFRVANRIVFHFKYAAKLVKYIHFITLPRLDFWMFLGTN